MVFRARVNNYAMHNLGPMSIVLAALHCNLRRSWIVSRPRIVSLVVPLRCWWACRNHCGESWTDDKRTYVLLHSPSEHLVRYSKIKFRTAPMSNSSVLSAGFSSVPPIVQLPPLLLDWVHGLRILLCLPGVLSASASKPPPHTEKYVMHPGQLRSRVHASTSAQVVTEGKTDENRGSMNSASVNRGANHFGDGLTQLARLVGSLCGVSDIHKTVRCQ